MKKRIVAVLLVAAMSFSLLTACRDSSENKNTVDIKQTDYDPAEEVKDFEFGELSEEEKSYTIEMGYNNCDHMVAAIIGEKAGIYEALGLKVNVTKSGETTKALISGAMDCGYIGVGASGLSQDPPYFIAAANHVGGSRYLVVSDDIDPTDPQQLVGKTIAMVAKPQENSEFRAWARDYGIPFMPEDYNIVSMGQQDAMFALKAGQIDAFVCCDPYASIAEFEGFGHIMFTSWGINRSDDDDLPESDDWSRCCTLAMNKEFEKNHPELARRLVYAHMLSVKYLYEHPYNASMMFADGFDCDPYVGLRTVYMKTVAEGRTITWEWTEANLQNDEDFDTQFTDPPIAEVDICYTEIFEASLKKATALFESAGLEHFDEFIARDVDPISPLGITFEDWYEHAKIIDGISDEDAIDISKTATPYLNENLEERAAEVPKRVTSAK
ncbi:MAG: ABC transporter substrate-binding subunit SaoX [bacterium]|nr:ABC transporter substrate-binding subunit SaoX [bacterium]